RRGPTSWNRRASRKLTCPDCHDGAAWHLSPGARRAYRLLLAVSPNPEADVLQWFDRAIAAAERSAADGRPERDIGEAAEDAQRRARGGMAQAVPPGGRPRALPVYNQLLYAAGNAAAQAAKAVLENGPAA